MRMMMRCFLSVTLTSMVALAAGSCKYDFEVHGPDNKNIEMSNVCSVGTETPITTDEQWLSLLDEAKSDDGVTIVRFHAGFCHHCKKMSPELKAAAGDAAAAGVKAKFVDADLQQLPFLAKKYDAYVGGYPSIFYIRTKDGVLLKTYNGKREQAELLDALKATASPSDDILKESPIDAEKAARKAAALKKAEEREARKHSWLYFDNYSTLGKVGVVATGIAIVGGIYWFIVKPMNDRHRAEKAKMAVENQAKLDAQKKAQEALMKSPTDIMKNDSIDEEDSSLEIIVIIVIILLVTLLLGYFGYTAYKGTDDEDEDDEDLESPEEK